jgi:hypothetical protein
MSLAKYIEQKNSWDRLFNKQPRYNMRNLTHVDAQQLMNSIENDLSPENLTCDGELSRAQVMERSAYLNAAQRELAKLFPNVQPSYEY